MDYNSHLTRNGVKAISMNTEDTKEAKAENRRTEIIITPKLNEVFKILEQN